MYGGNAHWGIVTWLVFLAELPPGSITAPYVLGSSYCKAIMTLQPDTQRFQKNGTIKGTIHPQIKSCQEVTKRCGGFVQKGMNTALPSQAEQIAKVDAHIVLDVKQYQGLMTYKHCFPKYLKNGFMKRMGMKIRTKYLHFPIKKYGGNVRKDMSITQQ